MPKSVVLRSNKIAVQGPEEFSGIGEQAFDSFEARTDRVDAPVL
jgi:hypothetical protein